MEVVAEVLHVHVLVCQLGRSQLEVDRVHDWRYSRSRAKGRTPLRRLVAVLEQGLFWRL